MNDATPLDAIAPLAGRIESLADFEARIAPDFPLFISRYRALTLDRLDEPGPEYESMIDGWLSLGDKSVIGGPSQSGKSFLAIHMGMCIATGRDFFGAKVKPGLVVYIAGEGARGVKKRLRAWRQHFNASFTRETPFVLIQSPVDLYKPDGDTEPLLVEIENIRRMFEAAPLRLIVIDTLATAAVGADENSSKDIGLVLANVAKLNQRTGAHVSLVHHMNADGTKLRGSTAIYANIEQAIYVTRNEVTKVRTARIGKQKDEDASGSLQFELMSINLGVDVHGKAITSCVCVSVGEREAIRKSEEAKGLRLLDQEIVFMKALFAADKRHGLPVPHDMPGPSDKVRSVVPYTEVRRVFGQLNPPETDPDANEEEKAKALTTHREMLKKRLTRIRESLTARGVISFGEHKKEALVWWSGVALRAFPWTFRREEPETAADPALADRLDEMSSVDF